MKRAVVLLAATGLVGPVAAEQRDAFTRAENESVLVFGGTGRTGTEIVRELRRRGAAVTVFVRESSDRSPIESLGVEFVVGDATSADAVDTAMANAPFTAVISAIGKRPGQQVRPDYTIIRPGGLGAGKAEISEDVSIVGVGINRADLALLTVDVVFDDSTVGKILHVFDRTIASLER